MREKSESETTHAAMDDHDEVAAIDHTDSNREEMTSTRVDVDKLLSDVGDFGR